MSFPRVQSRRRITATATLQYVNKFPASHNEMWSPPGVVLMKLKLSDGQSGRKKTGISRVLRPYQFLIVKPQPLRSGIQQPNKLVELRMAKAMGSCGGHKRTSACHEWKLFLCLGQNLSSSPLALYSSLHANAIVRSWKLSHVCRMIRWHQTSPCPKHHETYQGQNGTGHFPSGI